MDRIVGALVLVAALALPAAPAWAEERFPLDNRAPDLTSPRALTMPAGASEIDFGLGALGGPTALIKPIMPVPQLFWVHGFTDRVDLTAGLFGAGGSAFGRYALVPGHLNLEVGVQALVAPALAVEALAELQWDIHVGDAMVHVVPGVLPTFGSVSGLGFFGLVGIEKPMGPDWQASASLKLSYLNSLPLDVEPSVGLRRKLSERWAVEAIGLVQGGAPAALVLAGYRYGRSLGP